VWEWDIGGNKKEGLWCGCGMAENMCIVACLDLAFLKHRCREWDGCEGGEKVRQASVTFSISVIGMNGISQPCFKWPVV
jgi:hypothetical protein